MPLPPWMIHDQVNQFMIEKGHLLWKPLLGGKWVVVSLPDERKAFQVKADWENLTVLDANGDVHYAKSVSGTKLLMSNLKWHSGIWNFPMICEIFKRVVQNPDFTAELEGAWSCSHVEAGCKYFDGSSRKHLLGSEGIGPTTTTYVVDQKNRCIRFYDPNIPKVPEDIQKIFIPFPETSRSTFELSGIASSRSVLFIIGYDVVSSSIKGVEKTLAMYFLSCDANLLGLSPGISYTHHTDPSGASQFVLPALRYQKISLPDGELTNALGLERPKGAFMTDLVLTIGGRQKELGGYFFKSLNDEEWKFQPEESAERNLLPSKIEDYEQVFESGLQDCDGTTWDGENVAILYNFGKNALQCKIMVKVSDELYFLYLYPKFSQRHLVGFDKGVDTLEIPKETRAVLGWNCRENIPVEIVYKRGLLLIRRTSNGKEIFKFRYNRPEGDWSWCNIL